jgi:hypothetical protein
MALWVLASWRRWLHVAVSRGCDAHHHQSWLAGGRPITDAAVSAVAGRPHRIDR